MCKRNTLEQHCNQNFRNCVSSMFYRVSILKMWENFTETIHGQIYKVKVNEPRYITLFVFSGSIKTLFLIDCVNIYVEISFEPSLNCGVVVLEIYLDHKSQ